MAAQTRERNSAITAPPPLPPQRHNLRTFGHVDFVHKAGDDMAALNVKVVVGAVDVGRDDAGEMAPVLLVVGAGEIEGSGSMTRRASRRRLC